MAWRMSSSAMPWRSAGRTTSTRGIGLRNYGHPPVSARRPAVLPCRRAMPGWKRTAPEDAGTARRVLLDGLAPDADIFELVSELAPLHPRDNTFPGEVFLHVAADALDWCGASRADPPALEGLRERFLPERTLRGRQNTKLRYAVLAAAALQGGTEPDPLDEVAWWQADDFWQYALFAAVAYIAPPPAGRACRYARQARTCSAPWPPSAIMTTLGRSRRRSPGPEVRAGRPSTPARAGRAADHRR